MIRHSINHASQLIHLHYVCTHLKHFAEFACTTIQLHLFIQHIIL